MNSITIHHIRDNLLIRTEKVNSLPEVIALLKLRVRTRMVALAENVVEFREIKQQ
jgi:hypothetical protein